MTDDHRLYLLQAIHPVLDFRKTLRAQDGRGECRLFGEKSIGLATDRAHLHQESRQVRCHFLEVGGLMAQFQFKEMSQSIAGFAKTSVSAVEFGKSLSGQLAFCVTLAVNPVWVKLSRASEEFLLERIGLQPGAARFFEQCEEIGHSSLSAEAFAAGAAGCGVGVFHFEAAILQGIYVVEFAAGDIERAFGIDHDANARSLNENVAVCRAIL